MGILGEIAKALISGAINEMGKGMDAAKRSRDMTPDQLVDNAFSEKNNWDKAAAQAEIKRRYGV